MWQSISPANHDFGNVGQDIQMWFASAAEQVPAGRFRLLA